MCWHMKMVCGHAQQDSLDRIVPEGRQYRHLDEGMDDMPAHVKSSLMGASLTVPIQQGRLALGTWQVRQRQGFPAVRPVVQSCGAI